MVGLARALSTMLAYRHPGPFSLRYSGAVKTSRPRTRYVKVRYAVRYTQHAIYEVLRHLVSEPDSRSESLVPRLGTTHLSQLVPTCWCGTAVVSGAALCPVVHGLGEAWTLLSFRGSSWTIFKICQAPRKRQAVSRINFASTSIT